RRVTERTRALALANRDLREQIAERERVERRLKYETLHDSLTGLPNRTLLLQRLEQAMQRYGTNPNEQFAVLFIDLDRFKVINDSVGHLVGDDLLFQVGGRIRACLKTRDVVARLGGDEQRQGPPVPSRGDVRPTAAPRSAVAAGHGERPAPRAQSQRIRALLPADRRAGRRSRDRLRGAVALAPSRARIAVAA